jgi:hypothetical protein
MYDQVGETEQVCSGPWGGSGQEFDCLSQDVGTASTAAAAATWGGSFRQVNGKLLPFDFSNCSGGCLRRVNGKSLPFDFSDLVGNVLFFW